MVFIDFSSGFDFIGFGFGSNSMNCINVNP